MFYPLYEFQRSLLSPFSYWAEALTRAYSEAESILSRLPGADRMAASCELLHRIGKKYEKPQFAISSVTAHGHEVPVVQLPAMDMPFCKLLRMKRYTDDAKTISDLRDDPPVLVVAPLSGHHSTLLRDTVRSLLADHKVYVTDWVDARMVPRSIGSFGLDDYVDYVQRFIRYIGAEQVHVIAVCQPVVPVLAAISLMSARGESVPQSMTLMGGPIDPRESPTGVNNLATTHSLRWFRTHMIHPVPGNYPGAGRKVYPGFMQHAGFMAMNPRRHLTSHWDFYRQLVRGAEENAEAHRQFYDEYNAVLDMPAEYYLDTIRVVFQEHLLPRRRWKIGSETVDPTAITKTRLLTIEGALDDISGIGQTRAALALCRGIARNRKHHFEVPGAGHYGLFSGRRWRSEVYPRIRAFIRARR